MMMTRKWGTTFCGLVAAALLWCAPSLALAQEQQTQESTSRGTPLVVAVLNMARVEEEAKAFISIRDQISKQREIFQKEVTAEESALKKANDELVKQQTILAADAFKKKQTEFEAKFTSTQRKIQQRREGLEKSRDESLIKVRDELEKVIANLVKINGITLILRQEVLVFAAKEMDITDLVVRELDTALPTITVFGN